MCGLEWQTGEKKREASGIWVLQPPPINKAEIAHELFYDFCELADAFVF